MSKNGIDVFFGVVISPYDTSTGIGSSTTNRLPRQTRIDLTEKAFDFARYARDRFIAGDVKTKREILMTLGQNPKILNKKLSIELNEWLKPIAEVYPGLKEEYQRFKPNESTVLTAQNEASASFRTSWLGERDFCSLTLRVQTGIT